jgi:hypothetical protein
MLGRASVDIALAVHLPQRRRDRRGLLGVPGGELELGRHVLAAGRGPPDPGDGAGWREAPDMIDVPFAMLELRWSCRTEWVDVMEPDGSLRLRHRDPTRLTCP